MGNGLLARLSKGRVPQVDRLDGWPPTLSASHRGGELDRIPPTGRLTVTNAEKYLGVPETRSRPEGPVPGNQNTVAVPSVVTKV